MKAEMTNEAKVKDAKEKETKFYKDVHRDMQKRLKRKSEEDDEGKADKIKRAVDSSNPLSVRPPLDLALARRKRNLDDGRGREDLVKKK